MKTGACQPQGLEPRVQRVGCGECLNPVTQAGKVRVGVGNQCLGDDVRDFAERCLAEAAGGQGGGADAEAGGDHRRARVEQPS